MRLLGQPYTTLQRPILILSSKAGRGNTSIAEAILEYFDGADDVCHRSIEEFLPRAALEEDLLRYKLISSYVPVLLSAIYTCPFFYRRKLTREQRQRTRLPAFRDFLVSRQIATVVCVSHRQAFWTTVLKRNESLDVSVYGVLTEFGTNLGWKYLFWDAMDGFVSPVPASELRIGIPATVPFHHVPLPARSAFGALPLPSNPTKEGLLMGGLWGQGRLLHTLRSLLASFPRVHIHVVCGENARLRRRIERELSHAPNLTVYGVLDSILPLLSRCGCVVTKPGMGTLLEAHASRRKIFLFPGLPVAEANNARYAIARLGADWFSTATFGGWLRTAAG